MHLSHNAHQKVRLSSIQWTQGFWAARTVGLVKVELSWELRMIKRFNKEKIGQVMEGYMASNFLYLPNNTETRR